MAKMWCFATQKLMKSSIFGKYAHYGLGKFPVLSKFDLQTLQ